MDLGQEQAQEQAQSIVLSGVHGRQNLLNHFLLSYGIGLASGISVVCVSGSIIPVSHDNYANLIVHRVCDVKRGTPTTVSRTTFNPRASPPQGEKSNKLIEEMLCLWGRSKDWSKLSRLDCLVRNSVNAS